MHLKGLEPTTKEFAWRKTARGLQCLWKRQECKV